MGHRAHGWDEEYERQREEQAKSEGEGQDAMPEPKVWQSFDAARDYVRDQLMKDLEEWRRWTQRPDDIPQNPDRVYKNHGWQNWGDWFGIGKGPTPPTA